MSVERNIGLCLRDHSFASSHYNKSVRVPTRVYINAPPARVSIEGALTLVTNCKERPKPVSCTAVNGTTADCMVAKLKVNHSNAPLAPAQIESPGNKEGSAHIWVWLYIINTLT